VPCGSLGFRVAGGLDVRASCRAPPPLAACRVDHGAAFAIFLLWQLPLFQPDVAWERYNLAFHVLCTSFLIGAGAWLTWGKCQGNYRAIRSLELAAFAVPALFLAYGSWFAMAHSCQERRFFEFNSGSWMLLIFAYALFIPNTVRRAALVIGILAPCRF